MKLSNSLKSKKGVLFTNTIMLYLLTFSDYLIGFLVVPIETRALGKEIYGILCTATAMMVYFQLVIDFGFILSATEDVSRFREDKSKLSSILTSVTVLKLILSVASAVVLLTLCLFFVPQWKPYTLFYSLFLVSTVVSRLIPDFMYRGLEKMSAITVRACAVKAFFGLMIWLFLKKPEDLLIIPIFNIIGNGISLLIVYLHLSRKLGIHFGKFDGTEFKRSFRRSLFFFFSRIASAVYSAGNTLILSVMNGDTGLYGGAEKIATTAKSAMSPISDSLYPYMVKNRDFKLVKKVLTIAMPVIFAGCAVVFIFAEPLCVWFMGDDFVGVGNVLRTLIPAIFVILPSYILGFPTLSAMGLSKHANYSVIFGSALHIAGLVALYFTGNMNIFTLGCMVSVTETAIMLYRLVVVLKNRRLFNAPAEESAEILLEEEPE